MRNVSGHQGENERHFKKKKVNKNMNDISSIKVFLHGTIRNHDFESNTAWRCWNNVVTIRNNVATVFFALRIVVANRPL